MSNVNHIQLAVRGCGKYFPHLQGPRLAADQRRRRIHRQHERDLSPVVTRNERHLRCSRIYLLSWFLSVVGKTPGISHPVIDGRDQLRLQVPRLMISRPPVATYPLSCSSVIMGWAGLQSPALCAVRHFFTDRGTWVYRTESSGVNFKRLQSEYLEIDAEQGTCRDARFAHALITNEVKISLRK